MSAGLLIMMHTHGKVLPIYMQNIGSKQTPKGHIDQQLHEEHTKRSIIISSPPMTWNKVILINLMVQKTKRFQGYNKNIALRYQGNP
jgi:hypothetical protein